MAITFCCFLKLKEGTPRQAARRSREKCKENQEARDNHADTENIEESWKDDQPGDDAQHVKPALDVAECEIASGHAHSLHAHAIVFDGDRAVVGRAGHNKSRFSETHVIACGVPGCPRLAIRLPAKWTKVSVPSDSILAGGTIAILQPPDLSLGAA